MSLIGTLKLGGRQFAVGTMALRQGFLLTCLGLLVAVAKPSIAMHVAEIIGSYGLMVSAVVGTYQLARGVKDWRSPTADASHPAAPPSTSPAPRPSGTVTEPGFQAS